MLRDGFAQEPNDLLYMEIWREEICTYVKNVNNILHACSGWER